MKKKKNSAMKKLIPATSMLLVSATMLTASTYAWFTMSREVEVTGINMSAVVPEDLQIAIGDEGEGANVGKLLSDNTTFDGTATGETPYTAGDQVYGYTVKAPTVDNNTNDWHNSVAFSDYYKAARLIPASSTDGNYLFKTADATDQGETVSNTALFEKVTLASSSEVAATTGDPAKNDMAGLYVNGAGSNDLDLRANAGYYVDFPIWFRTSSSTTEVTGLTDNSSNPTKLQLGVKATITQYTGTESEEDLYHAVRIAVIPTTGDWNSTSAIADTTSANLTGVIHDGVEKTTNKKYYDRYTDSNSDIAAAGMSRQAVKQAGTLGFNMTTNKQTNINSIYGTADIVKQATTLSAVSGETNFYSDGEVVVSVPLSTDKNGYGTPVKYIIRVWLEGEDQYCWNPNAGQDWNISLKFVKLSTAAGDATNHAAPTNADTSHYGTASTNNTAVSGTVTPATGTAVISIGGTPISAGKGYDVSTKTFDAEITAVLDSTVTGTGDKTYQLNDGTRIGNSADLKLYIEANRNKYNFVDTGINLVQIIPTP